MKHKLVAQPEVATPVLRIGGLVPLTTTDYPGKLAAVMFCQGCSWQCGYCQNPHLIPTAHSTDQPWSSMRDFLRRRQGLLDAVVFSGGEPTLQSGLADAIVEAKGLGFRIGLHTAGIYPERLQALLPLLDWVGLDIKAPFASYERITRVPGSGGRALASTRMLLEGGVAYECRTTVHPTLLSHDDLLTLSRELASLGVRHYVLQEFRPEGCLEQALCAQSAKGYLDDALLEKIGKQFAHFSVRRA